MMFLHRLKTAIGRFRRDQSATVTVEFVIMAPVMVYGVVAMLQFFDAYRTEAISNKAALTIADMLSRETGSINSTYLGGTHELLKLLTLADASPTYRVTLFTWDEDAKEYDVRWSAYQGQSDVLDKEDLNAMSARLPQLSDNERALFVETWTEYMPKYGRGLSYMKGTELQPLTFSTALAISPRFATTVCWNDTPDNASAAIC